MRMRYRRSERPKCSQKKEVWRALITLSTSHGFPVLPSVSSARGLPVHRRHARTRVCMTITVDCQGLLSRLERVGSPPLFCTGAS